MFVQSHGAGGSGGHCYRNGCYSPWGAPGVLQAAWADVLSWRCSLSDEAQLASMHEDIERNREVINQPDMKGAFLPWSRDLLSDSERMTT